MNLEVVTAVLSGGVLLLQIGRWAGGGDKGTEALAQKLADLKADFSGIKSDLERRRGDLDERLERCVRTADMERLAADLRREMDQGRQRLEQHSKNVHARLNTLNDTLLNIWRQRGEPREH